MTMFQVCSPYIPWRFNADKDRAVGTVVLLRHGRSRDDPIRFEYGGWTARQVTPKWARGFYRQGERRASVDFRRQWFAQFQSKMMWAHSSSTRAYCVGFSRTGST
jgi:hypothetical protein